MNPNGRKTQIEDTSESSRSRIPEQELQGPNAEEAGEHEPVPSPKFATRADVRTREGMSSGKTGAGRWGPVGRNSVLRTHCGREEISEARSGCETPGSTIEPGNLTTIEG